MNELLNQGLHVDARTIKAQEALGLKGPLSDGDRERLVERGHWHVMPVARLEAWAGQEAWLGLRAMPGRPTHEFPVVVLRDFAVTTIAGSASFLIPALVFHTRLMYGLEGFAHVRRLWPEVRDELREWHDALGGQGNLDSLEDYVFDDASLSRPFFLDERTRGHEYLHLEDTREHRAFREYLQLLIENERVLPALPEKLGPWEAYARSCVAARAWELYVNHGHSLMDAAPALWLGMDKPAPVDSAFGAFNPIAHSTLSWLPEGELATLANVLAHPWEGQEVPDEIRRDPLYRAVQALADGREFAYEGREHMEAAAELDVNSHEPERSFNALVSAAFWSARVLGFPFPQTREAALMLSARENWGDVAQLLEQNAFAVTDI